MNCSPKDIASGWSMGAQGMYPPGDSNFFIFMQFLVKNDKIMGWLPPPPHPHPGIGSPPRGNPGYATDCIHCLVWFIVDWYYEKPIVTYPESHSTKTFTGEQ